MRERDKDTGSERESEREREREREGAWRERGEAGGGVKVSDAMVARWVAAGVRKRRV